MRIKAKVHTVSRSWEKLRLARAAEAVFYYLTTSKSPNANPNRGPAKGYIEALERRLHETENILLGLLEQVSDSQLAGIPHPTAQLRSGKRGTEYWGLFPLRSVQEIRSWQEDCQRSAPEHGSTSTSTPNLDQPEFITPAAVDAPVMQEQSQRLQAHESPEPQPSVRARSGAPSANFQHRFLW